MTTKEIAEAVGTKESFIKLLLNMSGYIDVDGDIETKSILVSYQEYINDSYRENESIFSELKEMRNDISIISGMELGALGGGFYSKATSGRKDEDAFVYIAKQLNEKDVYKIGIARNIEGRRKTFSTGNAYIEMIASRKSGIARRIEAEIHKAMAENRIKGEWFVLSKEELSELILEYGFNLHIAGI